MKNKLFLVAALAATVAGGISSCSNPGSGNTYRLVIAGMTDTAERREAVDFTNPYYQSELVLVVQRSDELSSDHIYTSEELSTILKDKILVSQLGTETYRMLDIFVENFGAIKANAVDSFTTAALFVAQGSAYGFTAEKPVAQAYVNGNPEKLMMIRIEDSILSPSDFASLSVSIGLKKGNDEFVKSLNGALDTISQETRDDLMTSMVAYNLNNDEASDNIRTPYVGKNGKIVVGLECNYQPFNWTEFSENNFTYPITGKSTEFAEGYDVEIAYRLAVQLDMTLEIRKMEWDALLVWLNS